MEVLGPVLFFLGCLALVGGTFWWTYKAGEASIRAWAKREGWTLERCEWIPFNDGPFKVHARGKQVWTIRARDQAGDIREGWALSANPLSWDPAGQVEVAWCEPGASAFR